MRTLIERFVRGESGVTAYGLIAAAVMLIGVAAWVVVPAPRVVASTQINPLEMMVNTKILPTSPAMAQNAPATDNPAAPRQSSKTSTRSHYGTEHHRRLYMSAKSIHKHRQLKPTPAFPDLTQRFGTGDVN